MTAGTKMQEALRETLKQEDAALEERLGQEEAPKPRKKAAGNDTKAAAKPVVQPPILPPVDNGHKDKADKVVRDSFSMPEAEHKRIKALREELGRSGRLASKSEVLRAGLAVLAGLSRDEVIAVLDGLTPVVKGKRKKS